MFKIVTGTGVGGAGGVGRRGERGKRRGGGCNCFRRALFPCVRTFPTATAPAAVAVVVVGAAVAMRGGWGRLKRGAGTGLREVARCSETQEKKSRKCGASAPTRAPTAAMSIPYSRASPFSSATRFGACDVAPALPPLSFFAPRSSPLVNPFPPPPSHSPRIPLPLPPSFLPASSACSRFGSNLPREQSYRLQVDSPPAISLVETLRDAVGLSGSSRVLRLLPPRQLPLPR